MRASRLLTASTVHVIGRENDGAGLYYYRARYYDPTRSRFVTEDPIGWAAEMKIYAYAEGGGKPDDVAVGLDETNRYSYAGNSPLVYLDPLGRIKGIHYDYGSAGQRLIDYMGYRYNQAGQLVKHTGEVIGDPAGKAKRILEWLMKKKPGFFLRVPMVILDPCQAYPEALPEICGCGGGA